MHRHKISILELMERNYDILIIGAGFSGLYAASKLSAAGKKVIILDARERTGGRVENQFGKSGNIIQGGPEFVHGHLPLTKQLIKRARASISEMEGEMYRAHKGQIFPLNDFAPGLDVFIKKAKSLKQDTDLKTFLDRNFKGKRYAELRASVTSMAEGFDAADTGKISVKSICEEWSGDSIDESYMIRESYSLLVKQLAQDCVDKGCRILLKKEVGAIDWKKEEVTVSCKDKSNYHAPKVIVTVPLGILSSTQNQRGHIRFKPAIRNKLKAAKQLGFGPVIKVVFEFESRIWDRAEFSESLHQLPKLGFLMNESDFPVFWVSNKSELPTVTAWVGGSKAQRIAHFSDRALKAKAISGLAAALNSSPSFIKDQLLGIYVFNWAKDQYTRGAYSYATPYTEQARKILAEPLADSLFFAGEALGHSMGTVEAAFESAEAVIKKIIAVEKKQIRALNEIA